MSVRKLRLVWHQLWHNCVSHNKTKALLIQWPFWLVDTPPLSCCVQGGSVTQRLPYCSMTTLAEPASKQFDLPFAITVLTL
jgi:hypothetical protein